MRNYPRSSPTGFSEMIDMNHGLKIQGGKVILTLGTKDGWRPKEVIVDGKIYKPADDIRKAVEELIEILRILENISAEET